LVFGQFFPAELDTVGHTLVTWALHPGRQAQQLSAAAAAAGLSASRIFNNSLGTEGGGRTETTMTTRDETYDKRITRFEPSQSTLCRSSQTPSRHL